MEKEKLLNGLWDVESDGHMKYVVDGNIHFEIEPELLAQPYIYHELECDGKLNMKEFLYCYITACLNYGLDEIIIKR